MAECQIKVRVMGYKNNDKISHEWIEAESIQEAYSKYQKIHPETTTCYLTELEGDIMKNKIKNEKGEKMTTVEKAMTTEIYVDPKTTDEKGNIVPVAKSEKEKQEALPMKEKKTSEKKVAQKPAEKKAEVKSVKQPAKVSKQNVKPESKKSAAPKKEVKAAVKKVVKTAPVKTAKVVAKKAVVKTEKKAGKPRMSATDKLKIGRKIKVSHGVGTMTLVSVHGSRELADKTAKDLKEKGKFKKTRVYELDGKFTVFAQ